MWCWNFSRIHKCHQSGKLFDVNQFERVDPCWDEGRSPSLIPGLWLVLLISPGLLIGWTASSGLAVAPVSCCFPITMLIETQCDPRPGPAAIKHDPDKMLLLNVITISHHISTICLLKLKLLIFRFTRFYWQRSGKLNKVITNFRWMQNLQNCWPENFCWPWEYLQLWINPFHLLSSDCWAQHGAACCPSSAKSSKYLI